MLSKDDICTILEEAFTATQEGSETIHPFSRDVQLTGQDGVFDSLGAMVFLDMADGMFAKRVGRTINLIDGDVFIRSDNPFTTMNALVEYIAEKLQTE